MLENIIMSISIGGLLTYFVCSKLPAGKKHIYKFIVMTAASSAVQYIGLFAKAMYFSVPAACVLLFAASLLWCEGSLIRKAIWTAVPAAAVTILSILLPLFTGINAAATTMVIFQAGEIILSLFLMSRRRISAAGCIPPAILSLILGACIYLTLVSYRTAVLWGVFAVSALAFVLFEAAAGSFEHSLEYQTGLAQSEMIGKHYNEVQNIYLNMRGWRHDYHNHLQTIKGHIALNQMDELGEYLDMLEKDLDSVDTILKTGNLMLDAILNSKVSIARSRAINVNAKAQIPEKLAVSDIDLCVIIGNLVDNASDACMNIENGDDRFIRIYIGTLKQQLYISVTNSTGCTVNKNGGEFITTKGRGHGYGIKRIDAAVNKYNGYVNRQNEPGVFSTEIMLPL